MNMLQPYCQCLFSHISLTRAVAVIMHGVDISDFLCGIYDEWIKSAQCVDMSESYMVIVYES